tara:strand:+ start:5031 stop:5231 length:201 start_codon:yes stop_codon:yes gene_type:complete
MNWIQIGAVVGIALLVVVRTGVWKKLIPSKKTRDPLEFTLKELASQLDDVDEHWDAWRKLVEIASQ